MGQVTLAEPFPRLLERLHPHWYPSLGTRVRAALLRLARGLLDGIPFEPDRTAVMPRFAEVTGRHAEDETEG